MPLEWCMDDWLYERFQKNPSHTNSNYSSLELFSEMLKFSKKKLFIQKPTFLWRKLKNIWKKIWICFFFKHDQLIIWQTCVEAISVNL